MVTTSLEKEFFTIFEIKPKYKDRRVKNGKIYDGQDPKNRNIRLCYPQITDNALLELILINMHNEDLFGYPTTVEELKHSTLKQLIETYNKFSTCVTCDGEYQQRSKYIKNQVQNVFKES